MKPWMLKFEVFNPLYPLLGIFSETLVEGRIPPLTWWLGSAAWAFGTFIIGVFFFISREREFAVRI
jgi:teichoic acid transport system permease protein